MAFTSVLIILVVFGSISAANTTVNQSTENDQQLKNNGCSNTTDTRYGHISRKDKDMINIVRGLDRLADELTEEEADMLDDLLDPNKQCPRENSNRKKRGCDMGCSIKCRYGWRGRIQKSCSNVGSCCDSYCYCSWFRRRANCLCYD